MPNSPGWILLAVIPGFALGAQTPPADAALRRKALGEVRTAAGKAWVGATVTLISVPMPEVPRLGAVDRVAAITDDRGRFRVPVLRNRRYSAWAASGRRISRAVEGVVAGQPVLLAEAAAVPEQIYEVRDLDKWRAYGPIRVQVVPGTTNPHVIPVRLDDDHRFALPPIPTLDFAIEVIDKDGLVRHRKTAKLPNANSDTPTTLVLGKPEPVYLAVRDILTEKGLAGATISIMHRGALQPIGKTDADGLAHLALPLGSGKQYSELFASAPGHAVAPFQRGDTKQVKTGKWKPLRAVTISRHTNLNAGLRFKGRIMLDKEHPAANVALIVRGQGMHFTGKHSRSVGVYRQLLRTDQDGRFALTSCLPEKDWRSEIFAVLSPRHVLALPQAWQREFQPRIDDFFPLAEGSVNELNDLGTFDLSALCPVRFSIVDHAGQPAPFARVALSQGESPNHQLSPIGEIQTDRMGRALFLLPTGDTTIILASQVDALALNRVEVVRQAGDSTIADVKIGLSEMWTVSGRILDAKGKPAAGLTIFVRPASTPGLIAAVEPTVTGDGATARPSAKNTARLSPIDDARLAGRIIRSTFGHRMRSTTDAEGRFRFRVPAYAMHYRLSGSGAGRSLRTTFTVEDQSVTDLQFELR